MHSRMVRRTGEKRRSVRFISPSLSLSLSPIPAETITFKNNDRELPYVITLMRRFKITFQIRSLSLSLCEITCLMMAQLRGENSPRLYLRVMMERDVLKIHIVSFIVVLVNCNFSASAAFLKYIRRYKIIFSLSLSLWFF